MDCTFVHEPDDTSPPHPVGLIRPFSLPVASDYLTSFTIFLLIATWNLDSIIIGKYTAMSYKRWRGALNLPPRHFSTTYMCIKLSKIKKIF